MGAIVGFRIEGPNEAADGGLGLYVRGGVQLSELFGIEDDLAATVGIIPLAGVSFLVRDAIDLTVTPVDWLTLAAGPMFSWGISESASAVGGTLRVDFHFPRQRAANGARRALSTPGVLVPKAFPDNYVLLVDSGFLYWMTNPSSQVMRAPVAGKAMPEVAATVSLWPFEQPSFFVVHGGEVYTEANLSVSLDEATSAIRLGSTCTDGMLIAESNELFILGGADPAAANAVTPTIDAFPYSGGHAARLGATSWHNGQLLYLAHRCGRIFLSLNDFPTPACARRRPRPSSRTLPRFDLLHATLGLWGRRRG